VKVSLIRKVQV